MGIQDREQFTKDTIHISSSKRDKEQTKEGKEIGKSKRKSTELNNNHISTVYIVGAVGSRFDHSMSNINALYKYSSDFDQLVLVGAESFVMLLEPYINYSIKRNLQVEGRTCGLLPLGTTVHSITTTGLRWDLNDDKLGFFNSKRIRIKDQKNKKIDDGCLFSSSNEIVDDQEVTIRSSEPLIWTTVINDELVKPI